MANVAIPGTQRRAWPDSKRIADIESEDEVLLTAWLRPHPDLHLDPAKAYEVGRTPVPARIYAERAELEAATAAAPDDVEQLRKHCDRHGMEVVEVHWRSVSLRAPLKRSIEAFGASVATFEDSSGHRFRHRDGSLHAPPEIAQTLHCVLGLHQWPRSHRLGPLQRHLTPLRAAEVAQRYRFPEGSGDGQVIGIIQLHGEFRPDDFAQSMSAQSIVAQQPRVKRLDSAAAEHKIETVKDLEAALDVQIAAALAPGARIVLYQAPDDERGVLDALRMAIFDREMRPSIISISYGWPEPLWTPAALDIMNELFVAAALLGITIFCSSGDNGAELALDGKPHVVAPASVPFAQACGATQIEADRESAWTQTGGGFSEYFEAPQWQGCARDVASALGISGGRGVPDLAGQESPGYLVYLDGTELAAGGTSAVAPMWSALAARLNERLGKPIGFFAPLLYAANPLPLGAITQGTNGMYRAQAGWNPCTGLGTPDGVALESTLRG
jgi:kumamolisin